MRASYGTLQLLGLKPGGFPFSPRTGFFLLGENCMGGCAFCPQAGGRTDLLSRITWPSVKLEDVLASLKNIETDRICLQAVKKPEIEKEVLEVLEKIKSVTKTPTSISMSLSSVESADVLFENGADTVSVAIDCASPELATDVKSISLKKTKNLLLELSKKYPGKIATHLIAGLGETDRQLVELSRELLKSNIIVSLFAFTPIKGTKLENSPKPSLIRYRRLQTALALIRNSQEKVIKYDSDGNIINLENYKNILKPSDFQTPGCDGCNRPYYNERPGGVIFNHPNPPDLKEIFKEIK